MSTDARAHDHAGHDHAAHGQGAHDHGARGAGALNHDGGHGHRHGPGGAREAGRLLGTAFWVAGAILAAEVAGGLLAHSLALLSDAGHMLTDVLSLGLAWYAVRLSRRPPTPERTYGFHRAGILAALFNAGTLVVVSGGILAEAVARWRHPVPVDPWIMGAVAAMGLAGNLFIGLRLGHAGHDHGGAGDLNVRSARLHVMGDASASAGVVLAGGLILLTHRFWWDPLVSAAIALLIARGAWGIIRQTVNVLMEGTPPGIAPEAVAAAMEEDPSVLSAHHVHIWSLDGTRTALSGHVVLRDGPLSEAETVLRRVGHALHQRFGIEHATLQPESPGEAPCPDGDCAPVRPARAVLRP